METLDIERIAIGHRQEPHLVFGGFKDAHIGYVRYSRHEPIPNNPDLDSVIGQ